MWNKAMYETEKRRIAEKASIQRKNLIYGIILAPILFLGWFPIVWIISKFVR